MLPVNYFRSIKPLSMSVECHGDNDCHKVEMNLATLSFRDITRFKTVVSVCLYVHTVLVRILFFIIATLGMSGCMNNGLIMG